MARDLWQPVRIFGKGPWSQLPAKTWPLLTDAVIFVAGLSCFYGVVMLARTWFGPFNPHVEISSDPRMLPLYAAYSLLRITIAYICSLAFALAYGYVAASNAKAERVLIPLLDVLQSIPVLSFLPPVMLAMVALFPERELGAEMGAILLIFTGQAWNMVFSFYASLKSIPRDMREATTIYRFPWYQRFTQLELPYGAIGLVWNSMMSVAGGWFFLMACEMFVLGSKDFRLPGLGSYLQTAASAGDTTAILWGIATMITVIVLIDQLVWRPVIAWAEKFKFEQVESSAVPQSWFLDLIAGSRGVMYLRKTVAHPVSEFLSRQLARYSPTVATDAKPPTWRHVAGRIAVGLGAIAVAYCTFRAARMLAGLSLLEYRELVLGAATTFLRVVAAMVISSLWTIPVGVAIGLSPRLSRIAQPLAQIAASVPATALFPIVMVMLIRVGGGLGLGSIVLLILGTQWYILFNVIAGAIAIPTDLKEASEVFRFNPTQRWRQLILPAIFPYLVTGLVTASGGAWNASIIAEYFRFRDHLYTTPGLGATIAAATDAGNFDLLLASTIVMALVVVIINRSVWRPLYRFAAQRFTLET